jgi:membrane protein implicated in regulation of membrane protease activity
VLVVGLRPWLLRHLRERVPLPETNAGALVGRGAVVVATVNEVGGRIKLNGEVWSARSATEGRTYAPGAEVTVERIDGATAIVHDQSPTAPSTAEDTRGAAPR